MIPDKRSFFPFIAHFPLSYGRHIFVEVFIYRIDDSGPPFPGSATPRVPRRRPTGEGGGEETRGKKPGRGTRAKPGTALVSTLY